MPPTIMTIMKIMRTTIIITTTIMVQMMIIRVREKLLPLSVYVTENYSILQDMYME